MITTARIHRIKADGPGALSFSEWHDLCGMALAARGWSTHHDAEVRKHWDYLVNKYADMPPRGDTSNEIANVTNDASNLAAGIRRYMPSANGRCTHDVDVACDRTDCIYKPQTGAAR